MKASIKLTLAAIAAMSLSACGGSDRTTFVKACIDGGSDKTVCNCMADKLEKSLSKDAFAALAKASSEQDAETEGFIDDLPPLEQVSIGVNMMEAAISCGDEAEE